MINDKNLSKFERIIGYEFVDQSLLLKALTHRSFSSENNERLEFLGDSIINFLIGEVLYREYPQDSEGKLSRLRAHLVKKQTLYEVGNSLFISDYIRVCSGELRTGGHKRDSTTADCVEAIIAAIFLDSSSMITCREVVLPWFADKIQHTKEAGCLKDPKTRLQEHMQHKHVSLPSYSITKVNGAAHNLHFEVSCEVPLLKEAVIGEGASKRSAEQDAAVKAIEMLEINDSESIAK